MPERRSQSSTGLDNLVLLLLVLINAPFVFLGYGTNSDSYAALDTGHRLLGGGGYIPSRNPGYLLFETIATTLSMIGGPILTNTATLLMSVLAVWCFLQIARELGVPHRHWGAGVCILMPTFWISAHSTVDFMWALACLMAGWLLLLRERWLFAGLLLGFAVGLRLASAFPAVCLLAFYFIQRPKDRLRLAMAGAIAALLGGACYVPSFVHAGWNLSLLQAHTGDQELWTLKMRLGRYVYKNLYLWGLPASILLAASAPGICRKLWAQRHTDRGPILGLCVSVIVLLQALFLSYPIRVAYLLPMVPFVMILVAYAWQGKPKLLVALTALVASLNFVNFTVAKPNVRRQASSARIGFWVEEGQLVEDIRWQWRVRYARTLEDFDRISRSYDRELPAASSPES
jgi:hypothetical protein